ncbi:DUF1972 domain-containing protein [Altericroceibacterium endophyticum]|uniref:DUF1972 domain-containing protein n=1 Tax=Altericroceibacterium endophyticum TaxID=1808508 RepID=A0A6I4T1R5_9SPHN|nr:DUF1972 domain-containing protein [Altericroceibacterium endophyticum]MXO64161.1 DUF1972 domain-containing protein [Altericroceibacterium endophyticum]
MRSENGDPRPRLIILGIRGVPAAHGGFETFAERLSLHLQQRGWDITVYCQGSESGAIACDEWAGITRIHVPTRLGGAWGTIEFDAKATRDVVSRPGLLLTLGYNTGFLSHWLALRGRHNLINMDGFEWKRAKYGAAKKAFLWINERLAARAGTWLIADHPGIAEHLSSRAPAERIAMIPYGGDDVRDAATAPLAALELEPNRYFTLIARPEPENSVLEIVTAFSRRLRGQKLVVLGQYHRSIPYQARVLEAASEEVIFPGAIYDKVILSALRGHNRAYLHGHTVGGTNPSLVEAMGAGSAVIAHDNRFNRWVLDEGGLFFANIDECDHQITRLIEDDHLCEALRTASRRRWQANFTWERILEQYETLLSEAHATMLRT